MGEAWWLEKASDVLLKVWMQPGAKKSMIVGVYGNMLKIKIMAPPVDGKANAALLQFLAEHFGVKVSSLSIESGTLSRKKVVRFHTPDLASLKKKFLTQY